MDFDDFIKDFKKGKHKKKHSWYPGKLLFKLIEALFELIGAVILIFIIARIFDFDFTSIASFVGTIIVFLIIRFIYEELS